MSYDFSVVLIAPIANQVRANKLACALEFDELPGTTFSVPFTSNGTTITHVGCHTWANSTFIDMLSGVGQGQLPETDWEAFGLTPTQAFQTLGAMLIGVMQTQDGTANLDALLSANNLTRYEGSV